MNLLCEQGIRFLTDEARAGNQCLHFPEGHVTLEVHFDHPVGIGSEELKVSYLRFPEELWRNAPQLACSRAGWETVCKFFAVDEPFRLRIRAYK